MNVLIKHRKADAEAILEQYKEIGDIKGDYCFDGMSNCLKIKNVLVLTDSKYHDSVNGTVDNWKRPGGAIAFFEDEENKKSIIEHAKAAKSEIWLVKDICCDSPEQLNLEKNITRLTEKDHEELLTNSK